jgi:hypothetical protein
MELKFIPMIPAPDWQKRAWALNGAVTVTTK